MKLIILLTTICVSFIGCSFFGDRKPKHVEALPLMVEIDSVNVIHSESEESDMNGVIITEISAQEYHQLIKDSCNVRLLADPTKFKETEDSLTIFTQGEEIILLNLPYDEQVTTDFSIQWRYDCFDINHNLNFFSFEGYEAWGYYAVNNRGVVSRFYANAVPVFCKDTDLFATWFEDPYESKNTLNVYKILSDGQLSEIAIVDLGEYESVHNPVWVGKRTLVAAKYQSNREISGYIRIDLTEKALKNNSPLPPDYLQEYYSFQKYNELVIQIKSNTEENRQD